MLKCCYSNYNNNSSCKLTSKANAIEDFNGKSYCQIHLPKEAKESWSDEKNNNFWKVITQYISNNGQETLDLSGAVFKSGSLNDLLCKNGNIAKTRIKKVIIKDAVFCSDAAVPLGITKQNQEVIRFDYEGTIFESWVRFYLDGIDLKDNCRNISNITFNSPRLETTESAYKHLTFQKCKFIGGLTAKLNQNINNINNILNVKFIKCTFDKETIFECEIQNELSFNECHFKGLIFKHEYFPIDKLSISNCNINKFKIIGAKGINKLKIDKTNFYDEANFFKSVFTAELKINESDFLHAPNFIGCKFPPKVSFHRNKFEDTKSDYADEKYRSLKKEFEDRRDKLNEILFYSLELECRRKRAALFGKEKLILGLYKLGSNYGQSIARPLIVMCLLLLIMSTCFYNIKLSYHENNKQNCFSSFSEYKSCYIDTFGDSILFSLGQTIKPFQLFDLKYKSDTYKTITGKDDKKISSWFSLFSFIYNTLMLGLFTLFILAIRRNYKMD